MNEPKETPRATRPTSGKTAGMRPAVPAARAEPPPPKSGAKTETELDLSLEEIEPSGNMKEGFTGQER
jgi:hypothetical protein